jgi:antitoxin (DNA-binding transcriptional repressor) of toxin-antitoxin stability system
VKLPGEKIIIAKAAEPVARPAPFRKEKYDRKPGRLKHLIKMKANFDDPLPPEIAKGFGLES